MPNFQNLYYAPQVIETGEDDIQTMREIVACGILDSINVGKFYGLVGSLVQKMRNEHQTKQSALIEKVKDLLGLHPEYTVGDIAKACTVSESALYATFRKYSDIGIHEIKKGVIMEKAKDLLITTDYRIEEISRMLNFSSSVYFRKCFKEHFGISPREMRKSTGI